jgi:ABC-type transport system substrate-binding protein
MRSTRDRLVALLLAVVLIAGACGGGDDSTDSTSGGSTGGSSGDIDADTGRRLRMIGTQGPQHMDPVTGVFPCEAENLRWVYDSLIRETPDGELEPGLAESWESPDPTTFVLHLREGVEFQDGTPFDAEAVKKHLERGQSDPASTIQDVLAPIESIETPDELTVILHLGEPQVGLLPVAFTGRAGMVESPTAYEEAGETYGAEEAVGAGPYKYDSHTPSEDMHVTAWDGYWDADNRYLAGIDMLGSAEEFQIERIRSGEVDYSAIKDTQLPEAEAAKESGDIDFRLSPTDQYAEIYVNWSVEPFDKIEVRQALEHALDRDLLVEALTGNSATTAWSPLSEANWAHDTAVDEMYPYDPDKSRELLAEAGYPDGVTVTVGMIDHQYYRRMAEAIQDMVKDAGFTFELEPVTGAEINNRLYETKDLPVAITAFSGASDPGITLTNKFSSTGNSNPAGTTADGVDELLAEGAASIDREERTEAYKQAEALVMENALSIPLFHNGGIAVFTPDLQGVDRGYTTCLQGNFVSAPVHFGS